MTFKNHKNVLLRMIVEYSNFFVGEKPIDVDSVLKKFDRHTLIKVACIQSCYYGNFSLPDEQRTYFSKSSEKHIEKLNELFLSFRKRNPLGEKDKITVITYRTSLELWRHIFAIKPEEYKNVIQEEDAELELFKVILTLNEKLTYFNHSKDNLKADELLYLNFYLLNDTNHYDFKGIMQPQLYYVYKLAKACEQIEILKKAQDVLFQKWGITSWQQYIATLQYAAYQTEEYRKKGKGGLPILNLKKLHDSTGLVSETLIDALSIDEDEYIAYEDAEIEKQEQNVDYREFRARPFIKLKNDEGYLVTNIELVCERLYNSLFFDFKPLINGVKGSVGKLDYNTEFVERKLFRDTIRESIPTHYFVFPNEDNTKRSPNEPDFYYRIQSKLVVFECKAIKMNGTIRDDGDSLRLFEELRQKVVLKTKNLDASRKAFTKEPEPIGIGQLIHHIVSIDEDTFEFDTDIPEEVTYYPILVFEDVRLLQPGLLSMLNRWFLEEMTKKDNAQQILQGCMPVMALSINTLYLYDDLILRRGLTNLIDNFVAANSTIDENGNYLMNEDSDFDSFLHKNRFHKNNEIINWLISNKRQ